MKAALLLATALVLPVHAEVACSWNTPGLDPFIGSRQAAVMSYSHIPLPDRIALAWRVKWGEPDHIADITAAGITGLPTLRYGDVADMHFGRGKRCATVDRSRWAANHVEGAAIYRRGNYCIVSPLVCGNISWTRCEQVAGAVATRAVPEPGALLLTITAIAVMILLRGRFPASPSRSGTNRT